MKNVQQQFFPCGLILMAWLIPQAECAEVDPERMALPTSRVEVVLDSDMYNEVDDQFALAYALHSANWELQRISLPHC